MENLPSIVTRRFNDRESNRDLSVSCRRPNRYTTTTQLFVVAWFIIFRRFLLVLAVTLDHTESNYHIGETSSTDGTATDVCLTFPSTPLCQ